MDAGFAPGRSIRGVSRKPRRMPHVCFTHHLRRYFPTLEETDVEASTVADVIAELDRRHGGLAGYLVDEQGALRRHVNIFVNSVQVRDRAHLSDALSADASVFIMQALSGG
jgi:molybdopterin converting factor small subunit